MKRTSILSLWLLAALGCGGKVAFDGTTDAGADPMTSCTQACSRVAATCGVDKAGCDTLCTTNTTGTCGAAFTTLTACIATSADPIVCGGRNIPASCKMLDDQWNACVGGP